MMGSLSMYVFLSLICCLFSFFLSSVSCAGSSPTLVDPNNPNPAIPRLQDYNKCSYSESSCDGKYYCANGLTCYLRNCYDPKIAGRPEDKYKLVAVPACVRDTYQVSLTAAIVSWESPRDVMRSTADACEVSKQMVILNSVPSSRSADDIVMTMAPWYKGLPFSAYDIDLGFFYEDKPDKLVFVAISNFVDQLKSDSSALLDSHTTSLDTPAGILLNTSNIQITPATFAIRRCSDGTAVTGSETCPPIDPALVPNNAASSSTKTTTQLLTIILPIVGGVVFCALIITALVIVRRRQANKVMRQTIQHTEPAVEVTMA